MGPPNPTRPTVQIGAPASSGEWRSESDAPASVEAVQLSQVDESLRELADGVAEDLPTLWRNAIRRAARSEADVLPSSLERAVNSVHIGTRRPAWWAGASIAQWVLTVGMFAGAVWLLALSAMAALGADPPTTPLVGNFALPAILVVAGLALGPLLALGARSFAVSGARHARQRAEQEGLDAVTAVAREKVLSPVRAELSAYASAREALHVLGVPTASAAPASSRPALPSGRNGAGARSAGAPAGGSDATAGRGDAGASPTSNGSDAEGRARGRAVGAAAVTVVPAQPSAREAEPSRGGAAGEQSPVRPLRQRTPGRRGSGSGPAEPGGLTVVRSGADPADAP